MCEQRENTTEGSALKRLAQKSKIFSLSFASQMSARFVVRPLESKLSVNSDKLSPAFKASWLCCKERRVDALALRADERRDKLRKASGRSKYPMIRRSLNGETYWSRPPVSIRQSITYGREPGELKHLSSRRKRKQQVIL